MQTQIGRVMVFTTAYRRNGWLLWESVAVVYYPDSEGHWCYAEPLIQVFDRYLTGWEAWVGHAMVVGNVRIGLELEKAEPANIPVRECIGGRWQTIVLTMTQYRRWAAEHDVAFAAQAAWGILHGELPPGSPWRIEAAPVPLAPEPHVKSA